MKKTLSILYIVIYFLCTWSHPSLAMDDFYGEAEFDNVSNIVKFRGNYTSEKKSDAFEIWGVPAIVGAGYAVIGAVIADLFQCDRNTHRNNSKIWSLISPACQYRLCYYACCGCCCKCCCKKDFPEAFGPPRSLSEASNEVNSIVLDVEGEHNPYPQTTLEGRLANIEEMLREIKQLARKPVPDEKDYVLEQPNKFKGEPDDSASCNIISHNFLGNSPSLNSPILVLPKNEEDTAQTQDKSIHRKSSHSEFASTSFLSKSKKNQDVQSNNLSINPSSINSEGTLSRSKDSKSNNSSNNAPSLNSSLSNSKSTLSPRKHDNDNDVKSTSASSSPRNIVTGHSLSESVNSQDNQEHNVSTVATFKNEEDTAQTQDKSIHRKSSHSEFASTSFLSKSKKNQNVQSNNLSINPSSINSEGTLSRSRDSKSNNSSNNAPSPNSSLSNSKSTLSPRKHDNDNDVKSTSSSSSPRNIVTGHSLSESVNSQDNQEHNVSTVATSTI